MGERLINILPNWLLLDWLLLNASLVWIAALLAVLGFAIQVSRKKELSPRIMAIAGLWGILGVHWGGHFIDVLMTPRVIFENPVQIFRFMEGGKGIYGALLGAGFFSWLYLRWKNVSLLDYVDAAVPAVALGYAIARIGCFLNGCCFGTLSDLPWAVRFPYGTEAFATHFARGLVQVNDALSLSVHPTQLYHTSVGLGLFLILRRWRGRWPGSRLAFAMASYGAMRFVLQLVRGDATPVLGFLDINQIFSLIFVLIAGVLWWRFGRKQTASSRVKLTLPSADAMHPERL